jgi:phosphoadenosine phosphosulfate reductase
VEVALTPPGDARPAFEGDIDLLRSVVAGQFGVRAAYELFPVDKLIVLNRTPALDRADEVVVDGFVLGLLRFDVRRMRSEFSLKLEGARRVARVSGAKWVRVDEGAVEPIINGSSVLAPGVAAVDSTIEAGDDVYIVDPNGRVIAVGQAKMSAAQMTSRRRGMAVRVRWSERPRDAQILPGGQSWVEAIEANSSVIKSYEERAKRFIADVVKKHNRPCTVAFSGGKDSLATLLLVKDVVEDLKILFVDTGLEFPETVEHTKRVAHELGVELIVEHAGDAFWQAFEYFGPPGRDYRWCCKTCKLGPTAKLIRERFPDGCVTFLGQRKYESDQRYHQPRIWENPWVPGQIGVSPIKGWTALHIWLYILSRGVAANPLYRQGLERVGCWLCPASELWEFSFVARKHPELWKRWNDALQRWAEASGHSKAWVERGFWRWQELPSGHLKLAEELGVETAPAKRKSERKLSYKLVAGFSPCRDGRTSAEGAFDGSLDIERVANMLRTLGDVMSSSRLGVAKVRMDGVEAQVYSTGRFRVLAGDEKRIAQGVDWLVKAIVRAERCVGCGVCVGKCPRGAISLAEGRAVIGDACTRCLNCYEYCPVIFF